MLYHDFDLNFGSYGCHFLKYPPNSPVQLHSIGLMKVISPSFIWNGLKRGSNKIFIFQYTLSGQGMIRIEDQIYPLKAGQAFLVEVPGDHEYYFPKESDHWQFLFIALQGDHAGDCWSFVNQTIGILPTLEVDSPVIRYLFRIYREVAKKGITDGYQAAGATYQFITELYREAKQKQANVGHWPDCVIQAVKLIESEYPTLAGLEDLALQVSVSKYHLARLFHQHAGITVVQYLTKIRVKKAVALLLESNYTIEKIAELVGYSNGKYFTKIFKELTGLSPGQYRKNYDMVTIDHLFNA
ncbi:AraC family transcriptional regulator [Cohnella sp. WQ 127256]|uniref:helix-turn-helix transcriptional regulator n=1 Tax=Cohnella sp. WQ 127256 TaxID=2938790 RepID=UPI002118AF02|nr:AraC family transcriptional regulator [Cohnella sp. WQ 127256]